jgi:hypothetical protein
MKPEMETKLTWGGWGAVAGAAAAMIVGFNWGGWTTSSTSLAASEAAVLKAQASICVAQFSKAPKYQERLKELKATNTWERAGVIEKAGWDRMPGEEKAGSYVGRACAEGLEGLMEK